MECDEHVCQQSLMIPCGDGQCAMQYNFVRIFATLFNENGTTFICSTLRDLAFQCEIHRPLPLWTLDGGFCVWFPEAWSSRVNATIENICRFLLKCKLSFNLSTNCPIADSLTQQQLDMLCSLTFVEIAYPPGPLLCPLMYTSYKTGHQVKDGLLPDYMIIKGQLRCAGFHLTINGVRTSVSDLQVSVISLSSVIERNLCRAAVNHSSELSFALNYSKVAPHFDTSCWHKWLPFFNFSSVNEIVSSCSEYCLSPHRIHNGFTECLPGALDERAIIRPTKRYNNHCLNCITYTQEAVCLSVLFIGYALSTCAHAEDTYSAEINNDITTLKCNEKDASDCRIIRSHILRSSMTNTENMSITTPLFSFKALPFIEHCDTYLDTATGIDEAVEHCLYKWTCADNEYRCHTGQCIPFDWLCDGKIDTLL